MQDEEILQKARQCLEIEKEALIATSEGLDKTFADLVRHFHGVIAQQHKIIFSGVGKSAHIAQKLAGTFNSIGARAVFLDATQAVHGDLGVGVAGDSSLLISNSGQSEELLRLAPILKRLGIPVNLLSGNAENPLASLADRTLLFRAPREACPLRLAPTASTTASLALGDALAMVLLEMRKLTKEGFARLHPAGQLGLSLLLKVEDLMREGDRFACLPQEATIREGISAMTKARSGALALVDEQKCLVGIFTDGDFRRAIIASSDALDQRLAEHMTANPITIPVSAMAVEAVKLFQKHPIDDLIAVNKDGTPVGLVDNQDLPKLRVV
ncbi:MAG: KpsF/GutQ family sugar-phosphate isomerase [Opitutales bacterium]|nr:KpsF/GutQ family sugar-phosphate isomerase [Opitutales bacterium]